VAAKWVYIASVPINPLVTRLNVLQSYLLNWIALGPDCEYPLRQDLSVFYKWDQTNDTHLSGLSVCSLACFLLPKR